MKNMSIFQVILMTIFGMGALIGVFVFATYSGSSSKTSVGEVVIWGTLPKTAMETTLQTITQENPDLKSVSYVQKDPNTLAVELASAIATGSGPDLVISSQENLGALRKFIEFIPTSSLPASDFTSTFVQGAEIFMAQGGYYGIPLAVDPLVLFYNRSILSSSGIAKPPATWEALTGLVPSVTTLTPTRQITRGLVALGSYHNVHNARGILSTLFLQTGVPVAARSANGYLVADLGVVGQNSAPPGEAVVGFYTQFADLSKVSYTWNATLPDSQTAFLSGDLALYLGYASEAQYLLSANPNLNFSAALAPQRATAEAKNVYGLIYGMMIPRGANNPAGAYQVASLFVAPATQTIIAEAAGLAPANLDVLTDSPSDPVAAVAYSEALYTHGWLSPAPASTDAVFSSMITDVTSGRSSLTSALVSAERSLGALLQQ